MKRSYSISRRLFALLMVFALAIVPCTSQAAVKPALSKKKISVKVGATYTLKIKNSAKSAKVTWKTSNKNVVSIIKKIKKGKKASAKIKGVSAGTATISAVYRAAGIKKRNLKCKVTVTAAEDAANKATEIPAGNGKTDNSTAAPTNGNEAVKTAEPSGQTAEPGTPTAEDPSVPTEKPEDKPTATPTKAPTTPPTAAPTEAAPATPKYTPPAATVPPVVMFDLSDNSNIKNEFDGASITRNNDGTLTIVFDTQYEAVNFYLPDSAMNYYSEYKYVTLDYVSSGGGLGDALYDADCNWGENAGEGETGKHPNWNQRITVSPNGNRITFEAESDFAGNCLRGIQIFNPNSSGTITITVREIIFSTTREAIPTPGPAEPTPTPTAVPTAGPEGELQPISVFLADTNYETPNGYDQENASTKGSIVSITYPSTVIKAGSTVNRNAKVALPKNYTTSKKYPVIYVAHGIFGNENSMVGSAPVLWNAVAAGTAKEAIMVFPNCCANESGSGDGFNTTHYRAYDNFLNDFEQCLKPYIDSHYSTYTDRAHTAICGFSMGGRVSLHLGFKLQETFRYIDANCPAPGIFDYTDMGVTDTGLFTKSEFTFQDQYMSDTLVMIVEGSNDTMVHKFPGEYHQALVDNGVPHIHYVRNGGHDAGVYNNGIYNFVRRIFK